MSRYASLAVTMVVLSALGCGSAKAPMQLGQLPHSDCEKTPPAVIDIGGPDLHNLQAPVPCLAFYRSVQERPAQNDEKAVAVAISGGGYRASNFALGVLIGLESIKTKRSNLLGEIDYFSTVSGGGFAAGAYLATLHDHLAGGGTSRTGSSKDYSLERANRQTLAPIFERRLERSLLRAAIQPGLGRNEYLERILDETVLGFAARCAALGPQAKCENQSLTLRDVFVPDCSVVSDVNDKACAKAGSASRPSLPYWFANASVAGNGAIFPFSPDILTLYGVNANLHTKTTEVSDRYSMPLAVGMTASAAFPVGIPPTTLSAEANGKTNVIQLLDGGVADNLGALTALAVLKQDAAPHKVLIVIDAYVGTSHPYQGFRSRLSTMGVAQRASSVYLDSWRGRHRHVLATMAKGLAEEGETWRIVFLSFDELLQPEPNALPRVAKDKSLYEAVRSMKTKLSMSAEQRELVLKAGELVVDTKRAHLCNAFGCSDNSER